MQALEKFCVTKVAHCIYSLKNGYILHRHVCVMKFVCIDVSSCDTVQDVESVFVL